jgi:putative lipoic acid-binding regulatory protein
MSGQANNGEPNGSGGEPAASPLVFPTDYPIKVVGRSERGLRTRVDAVVLQHAPDLAADRVSERASGAGNFTSITYVIIAQSREQVTALVGALVTTEGVLMVI